MSASDHRARTVERACADAVEAAVLSSRVGQNFAAAVVDESDKGVDVQLVDVPVEARARGKAELGAEVTVRLEAASVETGELSFVVV